MCYVMYVIHDPIAYKLGSFLKWLFIEYILELIFIRGSLQTAYLKQV